MENNKKRNISLSLGSVFLLILVIGAAFAFYQISSTNNATSTTIGGKSQNIGQPILVTETATLNLNLTKDMMSPETVGTKYYATPSGTPVTESTLGSGRYNLATASLTESDVALECIYSYDISVSTTKTITKLDGFKLIITESDGSKKEYTFNQLIAGVPHEGKFNGIKSNSSKSNFIEVYIENTSGNQSELIGNEFIITLTPNNFSCDLSETLVKKAKGQAIAAFMVENKEEVEGLWSSGLEEDGLRYVGSGSYDGETTPSNFICFGTTSKEECKANEDKFMYRIIGVFPDEEGNQHLKLRKLMQLQLDVWNFVLENVNWGENSLYTRLNGTIFLENDTYDYLQNTTWSSKIEDWKWTAVNTKTYAGGNDYTYSTVSDLYLHEMNRSTKTNNIGEWTYPEGKIGLIYASDYVLSLGDEALAITGNIYDNREKLKTGWLYPLNNKYINEYTDEWIISNDGEEESDYDYYAWYIGIGYNEGSIETDYIDYTERAVTPVFYLKSAETLTSGTGTYTDPYIIGN